jgi:predicted O-linked N-acetylglucosamine transferase (SPINDLY family)
MDFIVGDILNSKMHLCLWDDLLRQFNEFTKRIDNNEKVIAPFPLLPLIDSPELLRKNTEVFVNKIHPKNIILPSIEAYLGHSKIRIGYFSPDLSLHPVAYLTAGLYEAHDRDHFEVYAFSFGPSSTDGMSLRIKAGVDHFHNVQSMSHQEITLLARSLEIDVAVDLGGHTANSRTDVFAMSAAPIQLSYIGYLGTMGADYYDYLIADPMMIPKENQKYYSEKIVYLPSFQVNDSKDLPPEVIFSRKDAKLPDKGFVFCCFNNTYKITPAVFDSWARILKSVEGSVLIIYASNEASKTNLAKEISLRGVDSSRLIFGESIPKPEYLARYRAADLFLDTLPYNAGTTASDALKMGLPMLTLKGQSYQARMGASILSALNLPELITNTSEEYEALAIELATNPEKLKIIKDKLVNNLSTAPLYNTPLFTKNLESAYTEMYERHHKGLEPDHIYVDH